MVARVITLLAILAIAVVTTGTSAHAARMSMSSGHDHAAHLGEMLPSPEVTEAACEDELPCGSADAGMCALVCAGLSALLVSPSADNEQVHGTAGHRVPQEASHVSRVFLVSATFSESLSLSAGGWALVEPSASSERVWFALGSLPLTGSLKLCAYLFVRRRRHSWSPCRHGSPTAAGSRRHSSSPCRRSPDSGVIEAIGSKLSSGSGAHRIRGGLPARL